MNHKRTFSPPTIEPSSPALSVPQQRETIGVGAGTLPAVGAPFIILYILAYIGFWTGVLSPIIVALPLKVVSLVGPEEAAATLGFVAAGGTFLGMLSTPIFGRLSDRTTSRFGRRRPWAIIGSVGGFAAATVVAFSPSVAVLFIGSCLMGVSFNCAFAALVAIISDRVPTHQRGFVSGLIGISLPLGLVGGTFLVQLVATNVALTFLLPSGLAAVLITLFALSYADRPLAPEDKPAGSWSDLATAFWINPRRHPDFGWTFASRFLLVLAYAFLTTYQTFYLMDHIGSDPAAVPSQIFQATVVLASATLVSSIIGGKLSDLLQRRKVFVFTSAVIYGVALIMAATAHDFGGFLLSVAVAGLGNGVYGAVDLALVTDVLPDPENAAKDLGIFNIASTLPQSLAPAIAPIVLALTARSYPALFAVAAFFALLSAVAVLPIRKVR